jgi:hypothetical protein
MKCNSRRKSEDHPYKDLAKSGYKPDMKCNSQIIVLYSWLNNENQIWKPHDFFCNPTFGDLKLPPKKTFFFNFAFQPNFDS